MKRTAIRRRTKPKVRRNAEGKPRERFEGLRLAEAMETRRMMFNPWWPDATKVVAEFHAAAEESDRIAALLRQPGAPQDVTCRCGVNSRPILYEKRADGSHHYTLGDACYDCGGGASADGGTT